MVIQAIRSPIETLLQQCDEELVALRDADLLRTLTTIDEVRGAEVRIGEQWLVSWCSNDYLGLAADPRVVRAASDAAARWGVGARASRLLAGSTRLHQQLEDELAAFFQTEAAVVFASGYLANLGALTTLLSSEDMVVVDRLVHASLLDACRASRAAVRVFPHRDAAQAARVLARYPKARRRLIVTEGIFSMDGDSSPLADLLEVAQTHDASLYLDDAHGAFVCGPTGGGTPEAAAVSHEALIYMGTLGKALGCQGGFVAGPRTLIDVLHNRARTFIYATALATPVVAAALEALRLVRQDPAVRLQLARNVQHLHEGLRACGMLQQESSSHIIPLVVGSSAKTRELSDRLRQRGHWAPAIRPPTVPTGTARLRLSATALHTPQQIDQLIAHLRALANALQGHA